jgi:hypothetical protein
MKEIKLTKCHSIALVDDDDYEELSKYKWSSKTARTGYYAFIYIWNKETKQTKAIGMHRMVINCPDGYIVDHINHNGLDNRKENLRIVTKSQNSMNTQKNKKNKYGYKGVALIGKRNRNKPYAGQLRYGKTRYYLGTFSTPEEAARAYDKKAKELFGEFACLNFPQNSV